MDVVGVSARASALNQSEPIAEHLLIQSEFESGIRAMEGGEYKDAFKHFETVLRLSPHHEEAGKKQCQIYEIWGSERFESGDFFGAICNYFAAGDRRNREMAMDRFLGQIGQKELAADQESDPEKALDAYLEIRSSLNHLDLMTDEAMSDDRFDHKVRSIGRKIRETREKVDIIEADKLLIKANKKFAVFKEQFLKTNEENRLPGGEALLKEELISYHKTLLRIDGEYASALQRNPGFVRISERTELKSHLASLERKIDDITVGQLRALSLRKRADRNKIYELSSDWFHSYTERHRFPSEYKKAIDQIYKTADSALTDERILGLLVEVAKDKISQTDDKFGLLFPKCRDPLEKRSKELFSNELLLEKFMQMKEFGFHKFKAKAAPHFSIKKASCFSVPFCDCTQYYEVTIPRSIDLATVTEWADEVLKTDMIPDIEQIFREHAKKVGS